MFEMQKRKISADGLAIKLQRLPADKRWLYRNTQLTNEDYHATSGVSSTLLKALVDDKQSDYYVHEKYVAKSLPAPARKDSFVIGSAFHSYLLEPEQFPNEFYVTDYKEPSEGDLEAHAKRMDLLKAADEKVAYFAELDAHNAKNPHADKVATTKRPTKAQLDALPKLQALVDELSESDKEPNKGQQKDLDRYHAITEALAVYEHHREPEKGRNRPTSKDFERIENRACVENFHNELERYRTESAGKQVLTIEQMTLIQNMERAAKAHPEVQKALNESQAETSVFWRDEETGLILKARTDLGSVNCLYDIKTADEVDPISFASTVIKYGYHIQAAHYCTGFGVEKFKFIVIGKRPPYEIAVYELSEDLTEIGYILAAQAIEKLNDCIERDRWPSWSTAEQPVIEIDCRANYKEKHLGA